MYEYFILNEKVTLDQVDGCINRIKNFTVDELLIISNLFDANEIGSSDFKIKEEDYLYLDDPKKIKIKNQIRKAMMSALKAIMIPLVNVPFNEGLPTINGVFCISLDDKLIVGSMASSYYSKKIQLDSGLSQIILIKKFLL